MESIKNVIIFITDQERAIQHFPPGWEEEKLPGSWKLKQNGLTFENAFTNACMCSPARSTWLSGFFPAQHEVKYTLEEDMPADEFPQFELKRPPELKNIATVMGATKFENVVYKGKWHCSKPKNPNYVWEPSDLAEYGFDRWNPQDAGANQDIAEGGGAPAKPWYNVQGDQKNNDGRFMYDDGACEEGKEGKEGIIEYLKSEAAQQQPFFLIISLVNPHDVLFYPPTYTEAGYDDSPWLEGDIGIPETGNPESDDYDDLSTKPKVQRQFLNMMNNSEMGSIGTDEERRSYINFYGNLMSSSDGYLVEILEALDCTSLLDDTLIIRTSDHGEMGLAHGGMRQKNFNFYEESIRVPLIFSNPRLYKEATTTKALVSHVDFLPTIAKLFGAQSSDCADWQGIDYSRLVLDPSADPVQDYIVFTYDDYQSGQSGGKYPPQPNHIVSIREERYKLAKYWDGATPPGAKIEWEMYDLLKDPLETTNLAFEITDKSRAYSEFVRLQQKLEAVIAERLQPFD